MLIHKENMETGHIKFIKYTGKWPNLCRGNLFLEIDGVPVSFGKDISYKDIYNPPYTDYPGFWESGGSCSVSSGTTQGEWIIDYNEIPDQYKKYATEIDSIFNDNVPWGCCGGCI